MEIGSKFPATSLSFDGRSIPETLVCSYEIWTADFKSEQKSKIRSGQVNITSVIKLFLISYPNMHNELRKANLNISYKMLMSATPTEPDAFQAKPPIRGVCTTAGVQRCAKVQRHTVYTITNSQVFKGEMYRNYKLQMCGSRGCTNWIYLKNMSCYYSLT